MSDPQFKFFEGARRRFGASQEVFWSYLTRSACVVPAAVAAAAAACVEFATLPEHAARIASAEGPNGHALSVRERLDEAVRRGLLLAAGDVAQRIACGLTPRRGRGRIQVAGVPTRDRPCLLRRLLCDFTAHLREYDRTATLIVVEDSADADNRAANRRALSSAGRRGPLSVRYAGRAARALRAPVGHRR